MAISLRYNREDLRFGLESEAFAFSLSQILVLGLVDQRALLDPGHHVAEFRADFLDRVLGELGTGRLERGLVDLVLEHSVAGKAAGLDVGEHAHQIGRAHV